MRFDPESLELNLRDLSRGVNRLEVTIPLREIDWNIDDVLPDIDEGMLDLVLDYGERSVVCTGTLTATFATSCARCLEPARFDVTAEIRRTYVFGGSIEDEMEIVPAEGTVSLLSAVREAVVLSVPGRLLCSPDCPGISYN